MPKLLRQHDDRAALGRFVGQRGELRRVRELLLRNATRRRPELRGLAVAQRDRSGLVEQQHVDVASGFDRAPRRRHDVRLDHAVHARNADRREQPADRGRNQADEQSHQHGQPDHLPLRGTGDCVDRKRQQCGHRDQEDQRQRRQQDRECDLVRCALALGAFHHRDHAVEEAVARVGGNAHDQPVGQHARAAGHRRAIAAGRAHDRGRLAGNRRLVDRGHAVDDVAVARHHLARLDQHHVALAQLARVHRATAVHRGACHRA